MNELQTLIMMFFFSCMDGQIQQNTYGSAEPEHLKKVVIWEISYLIINCWIMNKEVDPLQNQSFGAKFLTLDTLDTSEQLVNLEVKRTAILSTTTGLGR